jgi:hypothetical protein
MEWLFDPAFDGRENIPFFSAFCSAFFEPKDGITTSDGTLDRA